MRRRTVLAIVVTPLLMTLPHGVWGDERAKLDKLFKLMQAAWDCKIVAIYIGKGLSEERRLFQVGHDAGKAYFSKLFKDVSDEDIKASGQSVDFQLGHIYGWVATTMENRIQEELEQEKRTDPTFDALLAERRIRNRLYQEHNCALIGAGETQ